MKFITILFFAVILVSALKKEKVSLPEEKVANLKKVGIECAAEHNVDPELLSGVADGSLPRNEANNKFLYCLGLKLGLILEDGHANVAKLLGYVGNHPRAEDYKKSLNKCNEVTKENPVATIVEVHNCFGETSPIEFSLG